MEYNNKYTKFMDKLDMDENVKRELIEKLKKEENRKGEIGMKIRNKIIAVISALSVISIGGVAFANTMPEEWKNSIKAFFGIISNETYEEIKVETNETKYDNGYSLTLEDYGIDAETLLLSFDLKTEHEIELEYPFGEEPTYFFYNMVKVVDENQNEYEIANEIINGDENAKYTILVDKINSKEYKIYEIYTIDSSKITEKSDLYIHFYLDYLPEDASELIYDRLCEFDLEVPIDSEKIDDSFEEFSIDNAVTTWDSVIYSYEFPDGEIGQVTAEITKIKNSNILTKLTLDLWGGYHTSPDNNYTLKIIDENNNILLDRDVEYIMPGVEQDIIIPRIDMNTKLNITLYESDYVYNENSAEWEKTDIASGSIILDLSDVVK